ncbi:hypothetical protein NLJ89_g11134 [Agrocybe chaxingu]|uniref:Cytochrome P450 n=1 Tax=Agrocybe chaxingu TaxID=84603 RepID=A0A9W8JSY5_9AGAR|nr:hypothetical protein NLJ89_g11134 [Agrocybe chaxingu]
MFFPSVLIAALFAAAWAVWRLCRLFFQQSALANIPGPPAKSLWKGVLPQVFNVDAWDFHLEIAKQYGGVIKLSAGLFGRTQLYVFDPKAMYHIIVKDQSSYEVETSFLEYSKLMFWKRSSRSSRMAGEQHKRQRKMLNPIFSIGHMRQMVPTFYNVAHQLRDALQKKVECGPQEIELVSLMTGTALELIGQSGLGFTFNSFTSNPHPYSLAAKQIVTVSFDLLLSRMYFLPTLIKISTPKLRRLFVDITPWKTLHRLRDMADVLHKTSVEIIESKKKALTEGDGTIEKDKDVISILLRANMSAEKSDSLSEDELLGQVSTLTFAAMDTTSSAMSRTLWLLAKNQDVQDRLRSEIREARQQGDVPYDDLVDLPYLDAVCRETLRLYPPFPYVGRTTMQDAVLPLSNPIKGLDGQEIREILVPKHTEILVSIMASNTNPEIWGPDSYEWKPERWLTQMPEALSAAHIPGVYSHLGFKFSQLEMKVVISLLVSTFKFTPSSKEVVWQMNEMITPTTVGNETPTPEMPLLVELAA